MRMSPVVRNWPPRACWFPRVWFNEAPTEPGREALGYYHEKRDEERNIGLGPEHDWSSHAADAYGLMCCDYAEPSGSWAKPIKYVETGVYV